MGQIADQMFSSSPFLFLFIYVCCPVFGGEEQTSLQCVGVSRVSPVEHWHSTIIPIYNPTHSFISSQSVCHQNIGVYSMSVTLCKTCLSYFTFYFTLYCSWTHHSSHSRASCFLSREWHIAPSGSPSLWSPLRVAATIIPCTTFKHIPFALQFVQPGIITTPLNPHIAASLWVTPIPGLFCPLQGSILCFLCPVCFYSGKGAKCLNMNCICPHRNPSLNFVHDKLSAAVVCMCMHAYYGYV